VKGSPQNKENAALARRQMAEKLNYDPKLCEKLIPKFELGCRRISPGEGYLETFLRSNVHLTQSPIVKFTENAVHTEDGKAFEVDVGKQKFPTNKFDRELGTNDTAPVLQSCARPVSTFHTAQRSL
jgi:cation diffusion facilitator CzcD-associated flavoprotein CzcO